LRAKKNSRSDFLSHISSICLLEGRFVLQLPKPQLIKGNRDDNVDFDGLPCDDVYINLIQAWIQESCDGAFPSWHDFGVFGHLHKHISDFCHRFMEIPACIYLAFYVSLFWLVTKHKGRFHSIDEMLSWLYSIYDFNSHARFFIS